MTNDKFTWYMMSPKLPLPVLVLFCVLWCLSPATSFAGQGGHVQHLFSITASEQTGPLGVLGGLYFDEHKGRLYVTDTSHNRILAFDSAFKFVSEFTGGGALDSPTSLVRDSQGRFFVAQPSTGQVLSIDMANKRFKPMDFSSVPRANRIYPGNLAIDSQDRLYVVDRANQRILVFGPDQAFERQIPVRKGRGLSDVAVDGAGRIYALDALAGSVSVFDNTGRLAFRFGTKGPGRKAFRFPVSLALDRQGRVYVVDQHGNRVLVFDRKGTFLFDFAQLGWREGRLHFPSCIFVNNAGTIFVVDRQNARVSIFE